MLKNIYLKGLILSLGLHATVLSFFFFNNNNFKKSESSMTEVIIVSSDESIPSDEKTDYQKKIHDVKKNLINQHLNPRLNLITRIIILN